MRPRSVLLAILLVICCWEVLLAQKAFKRYPGEDYIPLPSDWNVPREWVTARMMWHAPSGQLAFGFGGWGTDYPGGDQNLLIGVRRLTSIDVRSVEQAVEFDGSDDPYNWPFMYAVEAGRWTVFEDEAKQLREYLDRGGFLMVDDFHGGYEWATFEEGIREVFPTEEIEDLPSDDPIFHMMGDVDLNVQIPGIAALMRGRTYERDDDRLPHWRGIRNKKGRVVVAICYNMDLGDAWEHSDDPGYPEEYATTAHKVLVNYAMYDLTH